MSQFNFFAETWEKDVADSISEGFDVHVSFGFFKKKGHRKNETVSQWFWPLEAQNKDLVASYLSKSHPQFSYFL